MRFYFFDNNYYVFYIYSLLCVLLILVIICLFNLPIKRLDNFVCTTKKQLFSKFLTHKEKYSYKKLSKSHTEDRLSLIFNNKNDILFCEKYLYKKKGFLLTLSRFVDLKINTNKLSFRSKNNLLLIEEIASVVACKTITSNKCELFKEYGKLKCQYSLKQKEDKIFKVLLAQKLIYLLTGLEGEVKKISKIIIKAKNNKRFKSYKKQIYKCAEIYGIYKFNANSTKILTKINEKPTKNMNFLFSELLNTELKIKIIIEYLTAMFS